MAKTDLAKKKVRFSFVFKQVSIIVLEAIICTISKIAETFLQQQANLAETARLRGEASLAYSELMMKAPGYVSTATIVICVLLTVKLCWNAYVFVKESIDAKKESTETKTETENKE